MGLYVVGQTVHGAVQRQAVYGDDHSQEDKDRHGKFAHLLNSLLHSQENDDGRGSKEEQEPAKRFKGAPYKAGKIVVGCGCGTASREKDGKVFDYPPSDDGVVGKDDDGDGGRQDAKESKA